MDTRAHVLSRFASRTRLRIRHPRCPRSIYSIFAPVNTLALSPLDSYLAVSCQFRLGELITEQPHPLTTGLSELALSAPAKALRVLHRVDSEALEKMKPYADQITDLAHDIAATLERGGTVFVGGCGATGRLALACEVLWRRQHHLDGLADRVTAFMAGGDAALVRSIENAEDHPEYGERHLRELGMRREDLLIAVTEGGETPYVIGAVLAARSISGAAPWFAYCNPRDTLCQVAQRSARVLNDPGIRSLNLTVGPMAITGSTRMQASTALMAAVGLAFTFAHAPDRIRSELNALAQFWQSLDCATLEPLTVAESAVYARGGKVVYEVNRGSAITVLTDTTERSPTFSMPPFANLLDTPPATAPCALAVCSSRSPAQAWEMILEREPRALDWDELGGRSSRAHLLGFDFSADSALCMGADMTCRVELEQQGLDWSAGTARAHLDLRELPPVSRHLILKMLLNAHSTVVMGRLGRYDGNVMTWVRPTCNKLVDRAVRYAGILLSRAGTTVPYETVTRALFEQMARGITNVSLVHATVKALVG